MSVAANISGELTTAAVCSWPAYNSEEQICNGDAHHWGRTEPHISLLECNLPVEKHLWTNVGFLQVPGLKINKVCCQWQKKKAVWWNQEKLQVTENCVSYGNEGV